MKERRRKDRKPRKREKERKEESINRGLTMSNILGKVEMIAVEQ